MDINELEILHGADYLQRELNITEEEAYEEKHDSHRNILDEILALELALYVLRETTGGVGFQIDTLYPIRRRLINLYETNGLKYKYFNEEHI